MKKSAKRSPRKPLTLQQIGEKDEPITDEIFQLRLYVAGQTPRSVDAFANLKKLCEEYLPGRYNIEVVDLVKHPQLAAGDQILAIPTLVRKLPQPLRRIVGDLFPGVRGIHGFQLQPGPFEI